MINLSKVLETRFIRLWDELRKSFQGQGLNQEEIDMECIIFLEGRVLSYLAASKKRSISGKKLTKKYYDEILTDEDMDAMHDAIDKVCPPLTFSPEEEHYSPDEILTDEDCIDEPWPPSDHTRPCPTCGHPDACDSFCPVCDV